MRARLLPILLLVSLLGATACGEDFEPKSKILYLRVLGVKADNPRLAPGQGTTLSALAVTAEAEDEVDLFWEVCPFTGSAEEGYPCVLPEGMPQEMAMSWQGEGETFDFDYSPELAFFVEVFCAQQAELVEQLPEGLPIPDCLQGYPARVRLTATVAATGEEVVAVKTLYLMSMSTPVQRNLNPVTDGLVPGEDAPETAVVGEEYPIRCQVNTDALEMFTRVDDDEERQEEVLISWYVRGAELGKDLSFYSNSDTDTDKAQKNNVTADEAGTVTVWCVLRDGRGGVDWSSMDIEVP